MAESVICARCGDENPADARFCIDCGSALTSAATGPTTRLAGVGCPSCGTSNPDSARFCVLCGRSLTGDAPARPAAPPTPDPRAAARPPAAPTRPVAPARPVAPRPPQQAFPRTATPPTLTPFHSPRAQPARSRGGNPAPLIFLIGLVVLMVNGAIWPGVLVLIGVTMLIGQTASGQPAKGMNTLFWLGGIAALLATGTIWPGIVVLFFLHAILNGMFGPRRQPW